MCEVKVICVYCLYSTLSLSLVGQTNLCTDKAFFYCGILLNQGWGEIHIRCSGIKDYIKARGYKEASKVHSDEEGLPSELGRGKGRREGILHHRCQDFWVLFPSLLVVEVKKKGRESRDRGEYEEVFNM